MVQQLASYQNFISQGQDGWQEFLQLRQARLKQTERPGGGAEKIAENILEDLFTRVLSWELSDVHYGISYADMVLRRTGIDRLIIEVKRPGSLIWSKSNIQAALNQARRYAGEQHIDRIAISDGHMIYACDVARGGLVERLYTPLYLETLPEVLWWLTYSGLCKVRSDHENYIPQLTNQTETALQENDLFHSKYKIPARCFAYVGDANDPRTWKLPYLLANGDVDIKRISGAIKCITSNYRGATVKGIPEQAIPEVLKRLSVAAERIGKMPHQNPKTSDCYSNLQKILRQYDRV